MGGDLATTPFGTIPSLAFVAFQLTFAVITPALITGAIADRFRFSAWVWFVALWSLLVYSPVAHWVFAGGWLASRGRSTSRAERSCTSTPGPRRSR